MESTFGTRLKEFRDARGWSQERVGFELEVSKATVSKWETGRAEPRLEHLAKILRLFGSDGLTLDYLIGGTWSPPKPASRSRRYVKEASVESSRAARNQEEVALLTRFRASSQSRRRSLLELLAED